LLIALSVGAVFMGANTYIGNGPNFMVKSIAEERASRCPASLLYALQRDNPDTDLCVADLPLFPLDRDMVAFDMHLHTSRHSPDSAINPFSLVRHAQQLGLTGVVITEHDWL